MSDLYVLMLLAAFGALTAVVLFLCNSLLEAKP